ncbi:hypothetical protein T492DRAFT_1040389 [Pavlovales sp. CCMP2436]|nr:hypothetical protein T492DRAFT_1040389 [Pavlovales sp. CCMP2436]
MLPAAPLVALLLGASPTSWGLRLPSLRGCAAPPPRPNATEPYKLRLPALRRRPHAPVPALYSSAGATEAPTGEEVRDLDPEQLIIPEAILSREDEPGVTPRELKDQTGEAIEYFSSERVPSALVAGATLGILFAYPLVKGEAPFAAVSKRLYMLLATTSLCNTLLAVFAASIAIVRLLGHEHEPMAKDPLVMMLRETPLLFLAVRVHYLTGLLSFVGALSVRMFTDYMPASPTFAKGLCCLTGSTLAFMLSLYNSQLIHFFSLGHMWVQYARCVAARLSNPALSMGRPAGALAFGSAGLLLASFCFFGASFWSHYNQ